MTSDTQNTDVVWLRALGTAVAVEAGAVDGERLRELWARCVVAAPSDSGSRAATDGETSDVSVVTLAAGASMESATQQITRAFIARRAGELLMFHAGAVAHPKTGRALVYVAPGGTGKSTLTTWLGREYGYVTDETVAVDPRSRTILAYPKPVTWAAAKGERKIEHAPDSLGLKVAPSEPWVAGLALLRRTEGRQQATFTPLDVVEAITMLAPETSSLSALDRPLSLLASLIADVGCTLVEYGDASQILDWARGVLEADGVAGLVAERGEVAREAADQGAVAGEPDTLSEHLGDETSRPAEPSVDRLAVDAEQGSRATAEPSLVSLADGIDVLVVDGEGLALRENSLLRLGPISAVIVEQLGDGPRSLGALAAELESRFGSPDGVSLEDAVQAQVAELRSQGVVASAG